MLLLDVDSNVAILSRSPVLIDAKANGGGNALLATYRCAVVGAPKRKEGSKITFYCEPIFHLIDRDAVAN